MQLNIDYFNTSFIYKLNSMRIRNYFNKFTVFALFLFSFNTFTFAQAANIPPREQKLLNGLKLLVWQTANAEKTSVKLRIHNGSAFDPQAKEGVMALLGEILFPNETVKEYFEQDLGGSLSVESNYDYIQINATGDNDKILDILEALATAVTKPQIDKDTTAKVKTANLEKVKELEKNPAYIADRAVAKRLFGNYPYGRPQMGTSESISKIDFADVLLAKQKFLTSDNSTLAVSGNVNFDLVYRAARRLFGGWEKADKKIPATFTQPDAPDTKPLIINLPSAEKEEVRVAWSGLARNDKDFFASKILTKIAIAKFPTYSIQNKSYLLTGLITAIPENVTRESMSSRDRIVADNKQALQIKQDDFEKAKTEILMEIAQNNVIAFWLDIDTYKLTSVKDEIQKANIVKLEDVQKLSDKLQSQAFVMIVVTKEAEKKSQTN